MHVMPPWAVTTLPRDQGARLIPQHLLMGMTVVKESVRSNPERMNKRSRLLSREAGVVGEAEGVGCAVVAGVARSVNCSLRRARVELQLVPRGKRRKPQPARCYPLSKLERKTSWPLSWWTKRVQYLYLMVMLSAQTRIRSVRRLYQDRRIRRRLWTSPARRNEYHCLELSWPWV
jgi:hypothetical protein